MTSASQIVGAGVPSGYASAGLVERSSPRDTVGAESARGEPSARAAASSAPQGANRPGLAVRLPGQEGLEPSGSRRPFVTGGAFTLAVALGLSLDQKTQPDYLAPAIPSSVTEGAGGGKGAVGDDGLTEEEQQLVRELKARDAEVRRHEAAHAAAGGQYAGAPTYTYQRGPDGRQYAVGGSVSIDTAPVRGDPEATIRKAQQIKAAASAPADPSGQDRRIGAQADALRQQAEAELRAERREESEAEATVSAEAVPGGSASSGDGFTQADFSGVAARYRVDSGGPQLVSIAV